MLTISQNDIVSTCIFLPFQGEDACQRVLDKAQENINTILKPNIREVLTALNSKVKDKGLVLFVLYAQYFNTENDDCAEKQDWSFPPLAAVTGLKLTIERRKKFNDLVKNINLAIMQVVTEYQKDPSINFVVTHVGWDIWVREAVKGQFCVPGTSLEYPDPKQPDLQFYRPTLGDRESDHDDLRQKNMISRKVLNETEVEEDEVAVYKSLLYNSVNPAAYAMNALEPRAPTPPGCPGDGSTFGVGLPDRWGKWFHPNELGHQTIASFAMEAIITYRSNMLEIQHPICKAANQFACNSHYNTGNRYLSTKLLVETVKTYCEGVLPRKGNHWSDERVFYKDTPEAHMFGIYTRAGQAEFTTEQCLTAFERIIHGCGPRNPMNFKLGGYWYLGPFRYVLKPIGKIRPWPMIEEPYGKCRGYSDGHEMSTYTLYGAGWASWDRGEETIYRTMSDCIGWDVTSYKFNYFDRPDKNGYEWKMQVHWPDHVMSCFRYDKVQQEAGGSTGGCSGTD